MPIIDEGHEHLRVIGNATRSNEPRVARQNRFTVKRAQVGFAVLCNNRPFLYCRFGVDANLVAGVLNDQRNSLSEPVQYMLADILV